MTTRQRPPRFRWLPLSLHRGLCAAALLAASSACTYQSLAPLPIPPSMVDVWERDVGDSSFLGLKTEENDSRSLEALFFEAGVRVVRVVENSPAARAGLRTGDVVLSADDHELFDPAELDAVVAGSAPGSALALEVQRGDAVFDLTVELVAADGAASTEPRQPTSLVDPSRTRARWLTTPGGPGQPGVILGALAADSPLGQAGLHAGDRIIALDGQAVLSARALLRRLSALPPGQRVLLRVVDPDGTPHDGRDVALRLAQAPRSVTGFHIPILVEYEAEPDGSKLKFELVDIWILSLFRYEREEGERTWTLLSLFDYSTGVGNLGP